MVDKLGMLKPVQVHGLETYPQVSNWPDNGAEALLCALARADFPVTKLELLGIDLYGRAGDTAVGIGAWDSGAASWQSLTALSLNNCGTPCGFDLGRRLSVATSLEKLELTGEVYDTVILIDFLTSKLGTTKLRSLKLTGLFTRGSGLVRLLAQNAGTLRELTLRYLCKGPEDCWRPLLGFIERELSLEHLNISSLETFGVQGMHRTHYIDEYGATKFDFKGQKAVRDELLALRTRGRYEAVEDYVWT
ncbi:hypothetical protein LTR36_008325 [Oleoguttula mirabilis]|uniref:Uncharacterized protein n=1 Tax=Oleoguttula mirabilis TaxID=1507867 RepID=A0AAV9J8N8_9PEZI|nr:hypothetical protein LTR36_008325 [Oleoguttula mirabilis]